MRQQLLTGCRDRFEDEGRWIDRRPDLAVGGVSWGWLDALRRSSAALETARLDRLPCPILALLAERDHLVDNRAARRLLARIPDAVVTTIPGAAHELLREADPVRHAVLDRIDAFASRALEARS
jgi:lysophospholipase